MMGFFGFLQRPDLGQGLERFAATPNALLLDVRTQEEYADGKTMTQRPWSKLQRKKHNIAALKIIARRSE